MGRSDRRGRARVSVVPEEEGPTDDSWTIADRVLLLRQWFSLSLDEAARALHVECATIRAWQEGVTPTESKRTERLHVVFELGRAWRSRSPEPVGRRRREPLGPGGRTLLDLLSADAIPRSRVMQTLRRIAQAKEHERASRPVSGAELAVRFGFTPASEAEVAQRARHESSRASRTRRS